MICDNCKIDKLITDFINSKNICYKCLYRLKMEKISQKKTEKSLLCRTCGNPIINKENQRKRKRSIFCSYACAEEGHKNQLNNYWTKKIG